MTYYIAIKLQTSFEDALAHTEAALKTEGFGIISRIDIQQTFKSKIDDEIGSGKIFGRDILADAFAHHRRKDIVAAWIAHRYDRRLGNIDLRADRQFQVGREGRNAAAAQQGIANERNPERAGRQIIPAPALEPASQDTDRHWGNCRFSCLAAYGNCTRQGLLA